MQYPLFYNSVNQDRVYDADSFSDWLKKFFTTGVFKDEMQVTAAGGMYVQVGGGYTNINGKVMQFGQTTLTVGTADSRYYRIDSVIVERNDTDRQFYLKIVPGGTGTKSSVTGVTPTRSGGIYQLVLARIKVKPGATFITQQDITDTRADSTLCGIVAGTVTQMDFEQFSTQFADYFDSFKSGRQADFDAWFANIQSILDEDTAGHLQNEIDNCVKQDSALISNIQQAIANAVSKTGDVMTGSLQVAEKMRVTNGSAADGQLSGTADGDFGVYDNLHNKWLVRSDSDGTVHHPTTLTTLRTAKVMCTRVSTSYKFTDVPALAYWNMVAVRFVVHENAQVLFFVRGENNERSLTDWPSAGKFRGGIYIDWANNRIGMRCLNAGNSGTYTHLVFFDMIYGVF